MYAVRLARAFTGKKIILKMAGGWHGASSDLSLGIKMPYDREESLGLFPELQQNTKVLYFNDIEKSLEVIHKMKKDLAGIILEPAMGEGGFVPATIDYLKMLRSETERLGALLIFDEVQVGMGRTGKLFAYEHEGVEPDLLTLAGIVVVLFLIDYKLALTIFSVIPLLFLVSIFFKIRVRASFRRVRTAIAAINAFLQENITGTAVVQGFANCRVRAAEGEDPIAREEVEVVLPLRIEEELGDKARYAGKEAFYNLKG
jgi:ABC-type multidrug transport system fused ATPase/permease subunit